MLQQKAIITHQSWPSDGASVLRNRAFRPPEGLTRGKLSSREQRLRMLTQRQRAGTCEDDVKHDARTKNARGHVVNCDARFH